MFGTDPQLRQRLENLESHLRQESPELLDVVPGFRELDKVAYRMGLLPRDSSYALQISWWPLISVLGTYSAGKSTFINHYLGLALQGTGEQAVDDKFTVICHSREEEVHLLPGLALDGDPRFPLYQFSDEIRRYADEQGEVEEINRFLQLKTCHCERLSGKILIDSPGFDADEQRRATLRITEQIINLSDLVLLFFDARHSEPAAIQETLQQLVAPSIARNDAGKFLYILNKIDTTAADENPQQAIVLWQRLLAKQGMRSGRFYTIYNDEAAPLIRDEGERHRLRTKRDADIGEITQRIRQVGVERGYRIVAALEKQAHNIEQRIVPLLTRALARWRWRTVILDVALFGPLLMLLSRLFSETGYWGEGRDSSFWLQRAGENMNLTLLLVTLVFGAAYALHMWLRGLAASGVRQWLSTQSQDRAEEQQLLGGFAHSTAPLRSLFNDRPLGWGRRSRKQLRRVLLESDQMVQNLNNRYAAPSGGAAREIPPRERENDKSVGGGEND